jgi:hypothetical protein
MDMEGYLHAKMAQKRKQRNCPHFRIGPAPAAKCSESFRDETITNFILNPNDTFISHHAIVNLVFMCINGV